jgi:hypothetical protein
MELKWEMRVVWGEVRELGKSREEGNLKRIKGGKRNMGQCKREANLTKAATSLAT